MNAGQPWISADRFIDIDILKSLELDIIKGICLSEQNVPYYGVTMMDPLGRQDFLAIRSTILELPEDDPYRRVFSEIEVATTPYSKAARWFTKLCYNSYSGGLVVGVRQGFYENKNRQHLCNDTSNAVHFPSLYNFVFHSLPFDEVGRVVLFINDHDLVTPIHTDGPPNDWHKNEFLWLRTNLTKKFFIYDADANQKHYVQGHSVFFDEHSWHGTDPSPQVTFSIRVDGVFNSEFRRQLGISELTNYRNLRVYP